MSDAHLSCSRSTESPSPELEVQKIEGVNDGDIQILDQPSPTTDYDTHMANFDLSIVTSLVKVTIWVSFVDGTQRIALKGVKAFILDLPITRRRNTVERLIWALLKHQNDPVIMSKFHPDSHQLKLTLLQDDTTTEHALTTMRTKDRLADAVKACQSHHLRIRVSFEQKRNITRKATGWKDVGKMITVWRHDRNSWSF